MQVATVSLNDFLKSKEADKFLKFIIPHVTEYQASYLKYWMRSGPTPLCDTVRVIYMNGSMEVVEFGIDVIATKSSGNYEYFENQVIIVLDELPPFEDISGDIRTWDVEFTWLPEGDDGTKFHPSDYEDSYGHGYDDDYDPRYDESGDDEPEYYWSQRDEI